MFQNKFQILFYRFQFREWFWTLFYIESLCKERPIWLMLSFCRNLFWSREIDSLWFENDMLNLRKIYKLVWINLNQICKSYKRNKKTEKEKKREKEKNEKDLGNPLAQQRNKPAGHVIVSYLQLKSRRWASRAEIISPSSILFNPCLFRAPAVPISSVASSSPFSPSRSRFKSPQAARRTHRSPQPPLPLVVDCNAARWSRTPSSGLFFLPCSGAPLDALGSNLFVVVSLTDLP
jgi:hypothetical protein